MKKRSTIIFIMNLAMIFSFVASSVARESSLGIEKTLSDIFLSRELDSFMTDLASLAVNPDNLMNYLSAPVAEQPTEEENRIYAQIETAVSTGMPEPEVAYFSEEIRPIEREERRVAEEREGRKEEIGELAFQPPAIDKSLEEKFSQGEEYARDDEARFDRFDRDDTLKRGSASDEEKDLFFGRNIFSETQPTVGDFSGTDAGNISLSGGSQADDQTLTTIIPETVAGEEKKEETQTTLEEKAGEYTDTAAEFATETEAGTGTTISSEHAVGEDNKDEGLMTLEEKAGEYTDTAAQFTSGSESEVTATVSSEHIEGNHNREEPLESYEIITTPETQGTTEETTGLYTDTVSELIAGTETDTSILSSEHAGEKDKGQETQTTLEEKAGEYTDTAAQFTGETEAGTGTTISSEHAVGEDNMEETRITLEERAGEYADAASGLTVGTGTESIFSPEPTTGENVRDGQELINIEAPLELSPAMERGEEIAEQAKIAMVPSEAFIGLENPIEGGKGVVLEESVVAPKPIEEPREEPRKEEASVVIQEPILENKQVEAPAESKEAEEPKKEEEAVSSKSGEEPKKEDIPVAAPQPIEEAKQAAPEELKKDETPAAPAPAPDAAAKPAEEPKKPVAAAPVAAQKPQPAAKPKTASQVSPPNVQQMVVSQHEEPEVIKVVQSGAIPKMLSSIFKPVVSQKRFVQGQQGPVMVQVTEQRPGPRPTLAAEPQKVMIGGKPSYFISIAGETGIVPGSKFLK